MLMNAAVLALVTFIGGCMVFSKLPKRIRLWLLKQARTLSKNGPLSLSNTAESRSGERRSRLGRQESFSGSMLAQNLTFKSW